MLFDNIPKFKIRASSAARIMTGGRGKSKADKMADIAAEIAAKTAMNKSATEGKMKDNRKLAIEKLQNEFIEIENTVEELPEGVKTYCENWLKSHLYEKEKTFYAKQADKGDKVESNSIEYLDGYFGWSRSGKEFEVQKNEIWRSNDFCQGTSDLVLSERIIDTKNSYDCFSFPLFEKELPNRDYWCQGQIYMELWGRKKFEVIYVLMDLPEEDIMKEARYKLPTEATTLDYEIFRHQYLYSHLDDALRIKKFSFEKDEKFIEDLKSRVAECQKYIETLLADLRTSAYNV